MNVSGFAFTHNRPRDISKRYFKRGFEVRERYSQIRENLYTILLRRLIRSTSYIGGNPK